MNKKLIKLTSGLLLTTMLAYTTPILAFTKEETVYSKTKSNGEVYETIVSSHLKNGDEENILKDLTDLINIENMNGDEEYSLNGEELTWNANGSDIYYQGESKKELPIKCKITYELDGKEISPEDLAGKSGKVKIIIQYENMDSHEMYINGRKQTLYTPFTVACGTIIKNTDNKNIQISNGKIINDGTKTMVLGLAMPGMQESLNISKNKIEIPSKVEITMETSKFKQGNIITFVTPKIFDEEISFDKLNKIYNMVDTLKQSSKQIEEGANTLKEGTQTYVEKSTEFNNGMKALEAGTNKANNSYKEINNGINKVSQGAKDLNTGATELSTGINALSQGFSSMPESINQLYEGSKNAAEGLNGNNQTLGIVKGVDSVVDNLNDTIANLETSLKQIKESCNDGITKLTQSNNALNSVISSLNPTTEAVQIETLNAIVKANEDAIKEYNTKINYVETKLKELNTKKVEGAKNIQTLTTGIKDLQTGVNAISEGLGKLNIAASALPENLQKLNKGSKQIEEGTIQLNSGTTVLNAGSKEMVNGLNTLSTSTTILANGSQALNEGATTINEGAIALAEGITKFNTEGINKICDYINGDIKDIALRAEKLQELSEEYKNFSKANENTAKEVKFILISDSVEEKEEDNE